MSLQTKSYNTQIFPLAVSSDLVVQEAQDELLIYNLVTDQAFCLNLISAEVWFQCNGRQNVGQIVRSIKNKKRIEVNEDSVLLTLKELNASNLLVKNVELSELTDGFNRRELIKKIGLTTVLAIPVITSLLAPTAIRAQSGSPSGICQNTCTIGGTCTCNGTVICPPGSVFNAAATIGNCVNVGVGIPFVGVNVGVSTCIYANICI